MPRPDPLLTRALKALESVRTRAETTAIEPTPELMFLLTWLAERSAEKWPYRQFLDAAQRTPAGSYAEDVGRSQTMDAATNGIYRQVGMRRG